MRNYRINDTTKRIGHIEMTNNKGMRLQNKVISYTTRYGLPGLFGFLLMSMVASYWAVAADWDNPDAPRHLRMNFPYQGVLERNGELVTSQVVFRVSLWDAAQGGNRIWPAAPKTFEEHSKLVGNGRFALSVGSVEPLGYKTLETGGSVYLDIMVKVNGLDDDFVQLRGRQQILSTPYSINAYRSQYAEQAKSAQAADNAIKSGYTPGVVPIGAIVAWHKSLGGVPSLDPNFVECNGQVLNDNKSPLHGKTIPNLNNPAASGLQGRYLRGSTSSGAMQDHMLFSHRHTHNDYNVHYDSNTWRGGGSAGGGYVVYEQDMQRYSDFTGGAETRPYSMTVVWIMRVK